MILKCLAVDDEPLALSVVATFCDKIPFLKLEATASNGIDAIELMKKEHFDLLFIDINMPNISGIEVVRLLDDPPLVIFTTAYQDYALTGFELSAIDYLVKPFSFDRFLKGATKAQKQCELLSKASNSENVPSQTREDCGIGEEDDNYIMVKCDSAVVKLQLSELYCIEGLKDYVKFYTLSKSYVVKNTMKNIEESLSSRGFMRVHKSFIINLDMIELVENNQIVICSHKFPLGNQYKEPFMSYINSKRV